MSGLLIVALVAEWISLGGMIKLQEFSTPISNVLQERHWNEMNEEWAENMYGERDCQAL